MASRTALRIAAGMAVVVVGALLLATASAAEYRVGDGAGWGIGVDYTAWASGKEFKVGDTLEFTYPDGSHNVVMMVDAWSYSKCSVPSYALTLTSGHDRVTLGRPGLWLFFCGVEGHCQSGMKVAVNVH